MAPFGVENVSVGNGIVVDAHQEGRGGVLDRDTFPYCFRAFSSCVRDFPQHRFPSFGEHAAFAPAAALRCAALLPGTAEASSAGAECAAPPERGYRGALRSVPRPFFARSRSVVHRRRGRDSTLRVLPCPSLAETTGSGAATACYWSNWSCSSRRTCARCCSSAIRWHSSSRQRCRCSFVIPSITTSPATEAALPLFSGSSSSRLPVNCRLCGSHLWRTATHGQHGAFAGRTLPL